MMLSGAFPFPSAHAIEPEQDVQDVVGSNTVQGALQALLSLATGSFDLVNGTLARNNLTPYQLTPSMAANAFHDAADDRTRTGGVGEWQHLGGQWRVDPTIGWDASAGWTMTNRTTGRYHTMDATLVTPMIDLSAYPLPQARVPDSPQELSSLTSTRRSLEQAPPIQLIFRHRYNFPALRDGGQVVVYTDNPTTGATPQLLEPIAPYGNYTPQVSALGGKAGFTGCHDWETVGFDLTPWAGRPIWLGFRAAAGPSADKSPSYFGGELFQCPPPFPFGWSLDDVQVVTPAFDHDVKIVQINGPDFKTGIADRYGRVPTGTQVPVGAVVLNAGAQTTDAHARVSVQGAGMPDRTWEFDATLRPGEVWVPDVTVTAPTTENATFTVSALVQLRGLPRNETRADPTPANDKLSQTFRASDVHRFAVHASTDRSMVDDDGMVLVNVTLTSLGNVADNVTLNLNESYNGTEHPLYVPHAPLATRLAPGASETLSWTIQGRARGEHVLNVSADGAPGALVSDVLHYYVHASPPPIYPPPGGATSAAWTPTNAEVPIPIDDGMWVARTSDISAEVRAYATTASTLRAGMTYDHLHLTVHYMTVGQSSTATIVLGYPDPADPSALTPAPWSETLPGTTITTRPLDFEQNLSWRTFERNISFDDPQRPPYADLWGVRGLEARVIVLTAAVNTNDSAFFLDDLTLTGIPQGGVEADRAVMVSISGLPTDNAEPGTPSQCYWEQATSLVPPTNCFRTWTRAQAVAAVNESLWRNASSALPPMDEHAALVGYVGHATDETLHSAEAQTHPTRAGDRIVSPVLHFTEATSPVLSFEHSYAFPGYPYDYQTANYMLFQVGFLELQYRRDDGSWSDFRRVEPDDGYTNVLDRATNGAQRSPTGLSYATGDGYFDPAPCFNGPGICVGGTKFTLNFGDWQFNHYAVDLPPMSPVRTTVHLRGQPSLAGVDLADRDVRIAFHVARLTQATQEQPDASWIISDVRVTPVDAFARDGAVLSVKPEVSYDWRTLGVGPGTSVPVNVTVQNAGSLPEAFQVVLAASKLGGEEVSNATVTIGVIPAGAIRSVIIPWDVGGREGQVYVLSATVQTTTENETDENPSNDGSSIGADGSLVARTHHDISVSALVFPEKGRETLARYLPITVHNLGNMQATNVTVTRTITRMDAQPVIVDSRTWDLASLVGPDPVGMTMDAYRPTRDGGAYEPDEAFFTPEVSGRYVLSVSVAQGEPDEDPANNVVRTFFEAQQALAADDFDTGERWSTNAPGVWGPGEGFRSPGGLLAANRTSGSVAPRTDAWIESPSIPLANAESAVVNLYTKYDIEAHYDGGVVEASTDGSNWSVVQPVDAHGIATSYAGTLVASNPLAEGRSPTDPPRAITGDSRRAPVELDGWVPMSFDLSTVPGLREDVVFHDVRSPAELTDPPEPVAPGTYVSDSMVLDHSDPEARWEIQNETERIRARSGDAMWWSQWSEHTEAYTTRTLTRSFPAEDLSGLDLTNTTLELSWWDHRGGVNAKTSWRGLGGTFNASIAQLDAAFRVIVLPTEVRLVETDASGDWNHLVVDVPGRVLDPTSPIIVTFSFETREDKLDDTGWAVDDIDVRAVAVRDGLVTTLAVLTQDDASEWRSWDPGTDANAWIRTDSIPARAAPWAVVDGTGPDGNPRAMWNISLSGPDVDARLVSPAIDLSDLGRTRALLRVQHAYDLDWHEGIVDTMGYWWDRKSYEASAVEISAFNTTTGEWDAWRQLFAPGGTPDPARRTRGPTSPVDGAPYVATLPDVGDTFDRFPRVAYDLYGAAAQADGYYDQRNANTSYVFSGTTQGRFRMDDFDLSPYVGMRVRFAFHAWSGAEDSVPGASRYWLLGGVQVIGGVLSSPDVHLRFRLATDASGLNDSWAIDNFEVSGVRYTHSIGLRLDDEPTEVASAGAVNITGTIQNYGPETRHLVSVGIRHDRENPLQGAFVTVGPTVPNVPDYEAVAGPFDLAPAGEPGSSARFGFVLEAGAEGVRHNVVAEVLQGTIGGTLAPPSDNVPGRARREWILSAHSYADPIVSDVSLDPPWLPQPGPQTLAFTVTDRGTVPATFGANFSWAARDGDLTPQDSLTPMSPITLAAGAAQRYRTTLHINATGNYTARVLLDGGAIGTVATRIGTNDVALSDGFEGGWGGWTHGDGMALTKDEVHDGTTSVLFGVNDSTYYDGGGLTTDASDINGGTSYLESPSVDLRGLGASPMLAFWQKRLFSDPAVAHVDVTAKTDQGGCVISLTRPMYGHSSDWELVRIPLDGYACGATPLTRSRAAFNFSVSDASGQGWRIDGVTIASSAVTTGPGDQRFDVTDSADKTYLVRITDPGLAPRSIGLMLDTASSKVTAGQAQWVSIEPPVLDLQPGGHEDVAIHIRTPAARGAFGQSLNLTIKATDVAMPFLPTTATLHLDFTPLARQDLAITTTIDGARAGEARLPLEESIPHEINVVVSNQGIEPSRPTNVLVEVVEDATGTVVSRELEPIGGLAPYSESEETAVVAATWRPVAGERGNHTVRVVVDPDHELIDYDRRNDDVGVPVEVTRLVRPDLAIPADKFVTLLPDGRPLFETSPGALVRVQAVVRNEGPSAAHDITIRLLASDSVLKEEHLSVLAAGDEYVIATNQFAPPNSTTYRVIAFTPDLELSSANNENELMLPIFPPEIAWGGDDTLQVTWGLDAARTLTLTNSGPFPLLVNLSVSRGRDIGTVEPGRVALAPGENATINIVVHSSARLTAGAHPITLRVEDAGVTRSQRTILVDVPTVVRLDVVPHASRGPPTALRVGFDAANTGNVPLNATARLVDLNGTTLGSAALGLIPVGAARFVSIDAALPAETSPGSANAMLIIANGTDDIRRDPIKLDVAPWGRLDVEARPLAATSLEVTYALALRYHGNVPTQRSAVILGAPADVATQFSAPTIALSPGEEANETLTIVRSGARSDGLFSLRAGFVDPSGIESDAVTLEHLVALPLDMRQGNLRIENATREPGGSVTQGDSVVYHARLRNVGTFVTVNDSLALFVDGSLESFVWVEPMRPGEDRDVRLEWRAGSEGIHEAALVLDAFSGRRSTDPPAYVETLPVTPSLLGSIGADHRVPAEGMPFALLAIVALALGRRRS